MHNLFSLLFFFFFFWIGKKQLNKIPCKKIKSIYIQGYLKSNVVNISSPITSQDHFNKAFKKIPSNSYSGSSSSQKILQLHFFHMHQNKHKGAKGQIFLRFFSMVLTFHTRIRFLAKSENIHFNPNIVKIRFHNFFVLLQRIKM